MPGTNVKSRFRLWPIVGLTFAVLLALVFLFAWSLSRETSAIDRQSALAHQAYQQADDAITNIRADVYRAALLAHDLPFAEQRPKPLEAELATLRAASESEVKRLAPLVGPSQAGSLASLRRLLASYWNSLFLPGVRLDQLPAAIPERRGELREAVLTIAEQIDALNESSIQQQEAEIGQNRSALRRFAFEATAILVSLGLAVTLASIYYLARLERRSERERERAEGAEIELRHLSQQLVTAQEEERKIISRELHDEVGQILTGLRMELGTIALRNNADVFAERLNSIKGLAEDALRNVRNLSLLLRPSMLDDLGLGAALQWQAKEFSRRLGIPISVEIDGELKNLPEPQRICLYRVVQEALTNSARHAQAEHVSVQISRSEQAVKAVVRDDGQGFDTEHRSRSLGLAGMEERVRSLGGTLSLVSQPSAGTTLAATLPLTRGGLARM